MANPLEVIKTWFFELIEDAVGEETMKKYKKEMMKKKKKKKMDLKIISRIWIRHLLFGPQLSIERSHSNNSPFIMNESFRH